MSAWIRRLRARLRYRRFDDDLAREIEAHRAMKAADLEHAGLSAEEARRQAARDLGNVVMSREDARAVWIAPWLQSAAQDVRYAATVLRRQPVFGLGAAALLGIGIGLVTAVFGYAYASFLRPWQVPDPGSVVLVRSLPLSSDVPLTRELMQFGALSLAEVRYFQPRTRALEAVIGHTRTSAQVQGGNSGDAIVRVQAAYVTGNYFAALRVPLSAGRGFAPDEDDYRNPTPVAVISDRLWHDLFDRDPAAVGRTVQIGGHTFAIVGVTSRGFADRYGSRYDLWMPMTAEAVGTPARLAAFDNPKPYPTFSAAGRLASGATHALASAELTRLSREYRETRSLPPVAVSVMDTRPITTSGIREQHQVVTLLFLALLLVLLLACANVGNLFLARGLARHRELAVRLSLGASRARLVRQLLTEASLVSALAAVIGFGLAWAAPIIVLRFVEEWRERAEFYTPDALVSGFAFGLAAVTALVSGLAPSLRVTHVNLASVAGNRHGPGVGAAHLRRVLLAAQVALATVLLIGAGLLTRAIGHAMAFDPGFDVAAIQMVEVTLPARSMALRERRTNFYRELRQTLRTMTRPPIAFAEMPPLDDVNYIMMPRDRTGREQPVLVRGASPEYFDVMGIAVVAGRVPAGPDQLREVIVNRAAATRLSPGGNPVGMVFVDGLGSGAGPGASSSYTIVGVVEDVPIRTLMQIEPVIYRGVDDYSSVLLVRDTLPAIVEEIRRRAQAIDAEAIVEARPLLDNVRDSLGVAINASRVAQSIGALALLLAAFGTFGVFAFAVEERRREIGIRLALGARASEIVRMVLRTSRWSLGVGLAVGFVVAATGAHFSRSFFYGLSPLDPLAYLMIAGILASATGVATWIPARRALGVNPAVTLRQE